MGIQILNSKLKNLNFEQRLVETLGILPVSKLISELMILGFEYASKYPLSLNLESTRGYSYLAPLLRKRQYLKNDILNTEVYSHLNKKDNIIGNISTHSYKKFFNLIDSYKKINPLASPLHIMANTGARASWDQIRQLIGFRGYLSNARGFLYDIPVMQSFNRGLNIYEYFLSSYGARKGIMDTALKTADAGYLTRRLVENSQNFIIKERYCGTKEYVSINLNMSPSGDIRFPLNSILLGKTLAKPIIDPKKRHIIIPKGTQLNSTVIKIIEKFNINKLDIAYSSLCNSGRSICNYCYGFKNISSTLLGESIGIIAGEAVGEPGTQMTLRTFHTGGVFKTSHQSLTSTGPKLFSTQIFPKNTYNSLFKLITINKKKFNKKVSLNPLIYTKNIGNIKTNQNNFNIFSTLDNNISYKLLDNSKYILKPKKNIALYNTSKGYCLSYTPLYRSIISNLKHKKLNNIESYLKSFNSGELLFKNALQLLVKNKNNQWILYSLKNILAFQNNYLQKKIINSGIHYKTMFNNKSNILRLFHLYPITYSFKEISNLNKDSYKKNNIIYNIPLNSNKTKLYFKTSFKNIYRYLLINIKGESLNLYNITDKYSLIFAN